MCILVYFVCTKYCVNNKYEFQTFLTDTPYVLYVFKIKEFPLSFNKFRPMTNYVNCEFVVIIIKTLLHFSF